MNPVNIMLFDENRWAEKAEFVNGLICNHMSMASSAAGTPLLVDHDRVYCDAKDNHTLIHGCTGSKKTRNFCIPTVYELAKAGESMIITDPKSEIYKAVSGYLMSSGYKIRLLNFRDPDKSAGWNLLLLAYRFYKAGNKDKGMQMLSELCEQLKNTVHSEKDPYWEDTACDTLFAIILMLFELAPNESYVNMDSVLTMIHFMRPDELCNGDDYSAMNRFWRLTGKWGNNSFIAHKMASMKSIRNTTRTFSCVMSTLETMLRSFSLNHALTGMISSPETALEDISTDKVAVFLIIPDETKNLHFLASTFIKQSYTELIRCAQANEGNALPRRVNYIIDEFANMPKISDMPAMISAARSRNIRFTLIIQSKQQLESIYGTDADTIRSNCANWIFLSSRETSLLEEISSLCGKVFVEGRGNVPLISPAALGRLKIGRMDSQALILRPQMFPYITNVKDYTAWPQAKYEPCPMAKRSIKRYKTFDFNSYFKGMI